MKRYDDLDLDKIESALENSITSGANANKNTASAEAVINEAADPESVEERALAADEPARQIARAENASVSVPARDGRRVKGSVSEKAAMTLYDWVQCVVTALVAGVLIFIFIGRAINIEGSSMYPTLHNGDEVIISNLFYTPKAGDVVVLRTMTYSNSPLVKRIIATEGQTVDIDFEAGVVYVDGQALEEEYVADAIHYRDSFQGPVTVPDGCIFVLGDNRNESSDSRNRHIGMVDERCVIGKVIGILLPAYESDGRRDWSRMGKVA